MSWEYRNELLLYQMAAIPVLVAVQAAVVYAVLLVIRLIDFACAPAAVEDRKPALAGTQAEGECVCAGGMLEATVRSGGKMIEVAVAPEEWTVEVERQAAPTRAPTDVQDARASIPRPQRSGGSRCAGTTPEGPPRWSSTRSGGTRRK